MADDRPILNYRGTGAPQSPPMWRRPAKPPCWRRRYLRFAPLFGVVYVLALTMSFITLMITFDDSPSSSRRSEALATLAPVLVMILAFPSFPLFAAWDSRWAVLWGLITNVCFWSFFPVALWHLTYTLHLRSLRTQWRAAVAHAAAASESTGPSASDVDDLDQTQPQPAMTSTPQSLKLDQYPRPLFHDD